MKEIEKIVVASGNPAKVERFGRMLSQFTPEVVGLRDLGVDEKPEEHGNTAEENAEIKAKFYASKIGLLVFSEDEALYVDFLPEDKQPGVHVRRIDGKDEVDDEKLLEHWEEIVVKVPKEQRTGRWHIAYCIATPDGITKTVALDHPIIFFSPSSETKIPGWPMSSLEGPVDYAKPHSELTDKERKEHEQRSNVHIAEKLKELMDELKSNSR
jgi:XTP/dITP diphosphohydrolase